MRSSLLAIFCLLFVANGSSAGAMSVDQWRASQSDHPFYNTLADSMKGFIAHGWSVEVTEREPPFLPKTFHFRVSDPTAQSGLLQFDHRDNGTKRGRPKIYMGNIEATEDFIPSAASFLATLTSAQEHLEWLKGETWHSELVSFFEGTLRFGWLQVLDIAEFGRAEFMQFRIFVLPRRQTQRMRPKAVFGAHDEAGRFLVGLPLDEQSDVNGRGLLASIEHDHKISVMINESVGVFCYPNGGVYHEQQGSTGCHIQFGVSGSRPEIVEADLKSKGFVRNIFEDGDKMRFVIGLLGSVFPGAKSIQIVPSRGDQFTGSSAQRLSSFGEACAEALSAKGSSAQE